MLLSDELHWEIPLPVLQRIVWEIPRTEEGITSKWILEASKMTEKVFFGTSSCPESKVHVFGPIMTPAFPKISVFHCNTLLQMLMLDMYIAWYA